jgi:hypothetical protein
MGRHLPAPPAFASPPPLWGDAEHVTALFAGTGVEFAFARGTNPWRFDSAEAYVVFMETHYGPTVKARERLTGEGRWQECRDEILTIGRPPQRGDGRQPRDARRVLGGGRPEGRLRTAPRSRVSRRRA